MVDVILRRPPLSIAVGISAVSSLGLLAWFLIDNSFALDFGVYHRVASEGLPYERRDTLNFPYPPTMLLWIAPLSLIPKWPAYLLFVALSLIAFVLACRKHLSGPELALALVSPPMIYCLLNGQVAAALTGLLLWTCGTRNRTLAGFAFAVIASIKPQFVVMAPLLLFARKDWEAFWSAAFGFFLLLVASLLAYGFEMWVEWFQFLDYFHGIVIRNGVLQVTITPASIAELYGLPTLPFLALGAVLGSILVIRCRDAEPLKQSAAVAAGSLLASPYAITYDLTAVVPFLVYAVFQGRILAAVALSGSLNPLPLLATAWELVRWKRMISSEP